MRSVPFHSTASPPPHCPQYDITKIRDQKIRVAKQMETSNRQFADWKASREKEVMQLRRQASKQVG